MYLINEQIPIFSILFLLVSLMIGSFFASWKCYCCNFHNFNFPILHRGSDFSLFLGVSVVKKENHVILLSCIVLSCQFLKEKVDSCKVECNMHSIGILLIIRCKTVVNASIPCMMNGMNESGIQRNGKGTERKRNDSFFLRNWTEWGTKQNSGHHVQFPRLLGFVRRKR